MGHVPRGAVALLHAQAVDSVVAGVGDPEIGTSGPQTVIQGAHVGQRSMKLPAQLADKAHPQGPHLHPAHDDLLSGQPREGPVGHVSSGASSQQVAGRRPDHRQHTEGLGHCGQDGVEPGRPVGGHVLAVL